MRIILAALNARYIHSNLAIRYLKSFSSEFNIEIFEGTINENPMDIAIKIAGMKPDIIGFSCYIWNVENTLKVCSVLKEINSDIKIVLGGPEVSYDGSEVLNKNEFIDYVLEGEGEVSFNRLLKALIQGNVDINEVEGLVHRNNGIIKNKPAAQLEDLNTIPFPYDELPDKIVYYEATRGCPFSCKYCLSSSKRGLRYFDIERVKNDLKFFIDKEVRLVKFVDRTFNANKNFSRQIWEYLIRNSKNTKFHFEIAADILDDETIEFLNGAPKDLFQFEVGVQTTNPVILKNINRVMDFQKVKEKILKIRRGDNIHCHLDLIAGLPGEGIESFKKSFNDCMKIKPDVLQLGFLKILKGTPMYFERDIYDIHYIKYPPYQVVSTKDMSFEELDSLIKLEKVFETYYNSEIFKVSMDYIISKCNDVFDFFMDFTSYLELNGFFNRSLNLKMKFKLMMDFYYENYKDLNIRYILLHDFIINTKKGVIPEFFGVHYDSKLKEKVYESLERIERVEDCIGKIDMKRILCLPADIKIIKLDKGYSTEKYNGFIVYNLENQEYCYI